MPDSFVLASNIAPEAAPTRRKVLVTGAAGQIGSHFATHNAGRYELRLMVRSEAPDPLKPCGEIVYGDLDDVERLTQMCRGIDTVLHLAAEADPQAGWESLLHNNIVGAYNLYIAAHAAQCRRVVYASSIHAVSGYPVGRQVHADDPVNPGDLYGVTKCFGEAMGRYIAGRHGLSVIVVRIGAFQPLDAARQPGSIRMLDAFISQDDMNRLLYRCIDDTSVLFAIVHGLSANAFNRLDITDTCQLLGYEPQDDLAAHHAHLSNLRLHQRQTHRGAD